MFISENPIRSPEDLYNTQGKSYIIFQEINDEHKEIRELVWVRESCLLFFFLDAVRAELLG